MDDQSTSLDDDEIMSSGDGESATTADDADGDDADTSDAAGDADADDADSDAG